MNANMRMGSWIGGLLLLAAAAAACVAQPPAAPASAPGNAAESAADSAHVLVDVQGAVRLSRSAWRAGQSTLASFGAEVRAGDILDLGAQAAAKIACADLTVDVLAAGANNVDCPRAAPVLTYRGLPIAYVRSGDDGWLSLLSPAAPAVMDSRPPIVWTPLEGAEGYTVTLEGDGIRWEREADAPPLAYPDDAPPLAPGGFYRLTVTAHSLELATEPAASSGFATLPAGQAEEVRAVAERIAGLEMSERSRLLLTARLYAAHELYSEAAALLLEVQAGAPEAGVDRMLGDLLQGMGLVAQAQERFEAALERAQADGAQEEAAQAALRLGLLHRCLRSDPAAARPYVEQAAAQFRELDDAARLVEAEALLGDDPCRPPAEE